MVAQRFRFSPRRRQGLAPSGGVLVQRQERQDDMAIPVEEKKYFFDAKMTKSIQKS